jgi:hypothetical protein
VSDPEEKTILHHVLLNANDRLLAFIIGKLGDPVYFLNKVSIEGNSAIHLALSSASFAQFKARSVKCARLVLLPKKS